MAHLNSAQRAHYADDGYVSPLRAFTADEARRLRARLEAFEQRPAEEVQAMRTDLHLLERWAWDVVTHPAILEPVTDLLGPDVLMWSMNWFIKDPGDGKFVSLHQDASYWGLEPHDVLTVWLALSDASPETGPMRFLPGSHRGPLYQHENTFAADNLLTRGQAVQAPIDEQACRLAPLQAGEMSLHHVRIVHGSDVNRSADRRIGMVLRFCGTHVRQTKGPDTAVLVAGGDRFGHFDLLSPPQTDHGARERADHTRSVTLLNQIVMGD